MFRLCVRKFNRGNWLLLLILSFALALTEKHLQRSAHGQDGVVSPVSAAKARIAEAYGKLPLLFEANRGQTDARVEFLARSGSRTLFLTNNEAVIKLRQPNQTPLSESDSGLSPQPTAESVLRLRFLDAARKPRIQGLQPAASRGNYLIGNDPRKWRTQIANFAQVKYEAVYPGVDVVWYGNQRQIEFDLLIAPKTRVDPIKLEVKGARVIKLDDDGALNLRDANGQELRLLKPDAWQNVDGRRREVACNYRIENDLVTFQTGAYDDNRELVIDPIFSYSTYLGGTGSDAAADITVDEDGNAYVTGNTSSPNFPGASPIQQTVGASFDAFVAKINSAGTALIWATWLGGNAQDSASKIAVDAGGNVYVTGTTTSSNFPLQNALQAARRGTTDGFVAKLNPTGSALIYSTLLGGTGADSAVALAVDAAGQAYVAGSTDSFDFPLQTPLQPDKQGEALFISNDAGASWTGSSLKDQDKSLNARTVNDVAIDPSNSRILYAATDLGIYKSETGGATWASATGTQFFVNSSQVLVDPQQPTIVYARLGSLIYKSTDAGRSWARLTFSSPMFFDRIAIAGTSPTTLYGLTFQEFVRSQDGGATWTRLEVASVSSGVRGEVIAVDPVAPATVYLGTNRGLFKTINSGAAWTIIGEGLLQTSVPNLRFLAVSRSNPQTVYAVQLFNGLFRTANGGLNWQQAKLPANLSPGLVLALAVDPTNSNTLYLGSQSNGLFKSTDGGETWNSIGNGLTSSVIYSLAIPTDAPMKLYAGGYVGRDAFAAKLNPSGSALVYSTYLGGNNLDYVADVAVDATGAMYLAGGTNSVNFPVMMALQPRLAGAEDAFVAKLNPTGSTLLWSTFLGGSGIDRPLGLAINSAGDLFVAGQTFSRDFPAVNAVQAANKSVAGQTAFVARVGADGQRLVYSTYLGGSGVEAANAIAVDAAGNAYVTGYTSSRDFPVVRAVQSKRSGRFETDSDAFVTALSGSGAGFVYSTYLGGDGSDLGYGIAVDTHGNAYVTGVTSSTNFPTTPGSLRPTGASSEAFVTKLSLNADLAVSLSALPDPLQSGGEITYLMTVTNLGPDIAEQVRLGYSQPAGTVSPATTTQGSCAPLVCNLGALAVGGKATVTLAIKPNPTESGRFLATATVTPFTPDLNSDNNSAQLESRFATLPSVYGRVTTAGGAGLGNVTVALTGAQRPTAATNGEGVYQFTELPVAANYTATPSRAGYVFNPPSRAVNNLQSDQRADFIAVACRFTLGSTALTLPYVGGAAMVTISSPDPQCEWTALSNAPWLKVNSAGGRGNGQVVIVAEPAVGARSGTLTIAGNTLSVRQEFNACGSPEFISPPTFQIENPGGGYGQPNFLVRDFNGDGIDDVLLLTRKDTQGRVSVMLGKTSGGFETPRTLLAQTESENQRLHSFDLKDLNADGKPDLIAVLRAAEGRVLVALAGNNGGFAAPVGYAAGEFPEDLEVADFNNDGKADIAVTRRITNPLFSVLLNTGDGKFGSPRAFNAPENFYASATRFGVSDFNADGKADLAILGQSSQFVVFLGNGAGGFAPQTAINTTFSSRSFVIADFNADSKNDVAIAGDNIQLLMGKGDGTFNAPVNYSYGNSRSFLVAEDFSGDGRKDLVVPNGSGIRYLPAIGDGKFSPPIDFYPGISVTGNFSTAVGDYNRDGRPDLYVVGDSTNPDLYSLAVMTSDNGGYFNAARSYPYQTNTNNSASNIPTRTLTFGDLNNDGITDVVIARASRRVEVLLGQGRGQFGAPTGYDVGGGPQFPLVRDFNNDGKPDVIVMNRDANSISILLGDGLGGLRLAREIAVGAMPITHTPNTYAVGDFNTDGKPDLLVKAQTAGLALLAGDGAGGFRESLTGIAADYVNPQFVAGDFNGDGFLDLVVMVSSRANECTSSIKPPALLTGDGSGGFKPAVRLDVEGQWLRLWAADLNNDRRDDLLFTDTCIEMPGMKVILARGDGGFTTPVRVSDRGGEFIQPFVGDINGDGQPDILENAAGGLSSRWILNRGNGSFDAPFELPQSRDAGPATIGDFDQDGSPDLAFLGNELIVLLNRGGCFAPGSLVTASAAAYSRFTVAGESIAALFGDKLAMATQTATVSPLPTTLANTSVRLKDSAGIERAAPLYFVSPNQINLQIPAGLSPGIALVTVMSRATPTAIGTVNIAPLSPALFTADAGGRGLAAAVVLRVRANGTQSYEPVTRLDAAHRPVALPIDLGAGTDRVFLLLFGSGLRNPGAQVQVTAGIGDAPAEVTYVGPQGEMAGLDQINLLLPQSLRGRGEAEIRLTANGRAANPVKIVIK